MKFENKNTTHLQKHCQTSNLAITYVVKTFKTKNGINLGLSLKLGNTVNTKFEWMEVEEYLCETDVI